MSYSWDPLNSDLLHRLSARRFVSLTLDRRLRVPTNPDDLSQLFHSELETRCDLQNPLESGNVRYKKAIYYVKEDRNEEGSLPEGVFDSGMPGVMSLEDLKAETNLGKWPVRVGNQIAMLEVRNSPISISAR